MANWYPALIDLTIQMSRKLFEWQPSAVSQLSHRSDVHLYLKNSRLVMYVFVDAQACSFFSGMHATL